MYILLTTQPTFCHPHRHTWLADGLILINEALNTTVGRRDKEADCASHGQYQGSQHKWIGYWPPEWKPCHDLQVGLLRLLKSEGLL